MLEIHQNGCSVKLKQCSMATSGQNLNSLNFTKLHHKTFSRQTTSNNGSKCNLCLGSVHILHLAPEFSCHKSAIWSDTRVWGQHDRSKVTRSISVSFPPFKDHIKSDNSSASLHVLLSYHCCQRFSVVLFLKTTHVSTRIQINICYYQFCLALSPPQEQTDQ